MKTILKKSIIFMLVLSMLAVSILTEKSVGEAVSVSSSGNYKGFEYDIVANQYVEITRYVGKSSVVKIPRKIKGKKVVKIGGSAFAYNSKIKSLIIPEGVEKINKRALFDMKNLKNITLPQSLREFTEETGFNFYTEASEHPKKTITVVKGSKAFKYVTKKYSNQKIKVKKATKCVVWFNDNGATWDKELTAKYVKKGKKYGSLPKPTKKGYKFVGWYTKLKGGKKVTEKTKAKSDLEVFARWKFISKRAMLANPVIKKEDDGELVPHWDKIYFGSYPVNGSEDVKKIQWDVLKVEGNKALVITEDGIDAKAFQNKVYDKDGKYQIPNACTWVTSDIRKWLNGTNQSYDNDYHYSDFYGKAFSEAERARILDTVLDNSDGKQTTDKIFLLSLEEYKTPAYYLAYNEEFAAYGSSFASRFASGVVDSKADDCWWLRTMTDGNHAYVVDEELNPIVVETHGYGTIEDDLVSRKYTPYVRPAMWIDLSDESLWDVR